MKLHDIAMCKTDKCDLSISEPSGLEIQRLLKARHDDALFGCMLLSADELELASYVIAKVYADACYEPSMTLLQAIRSINAKLALCGQ